ncbi:hypothetical protein Back11_46360 [Paenibacillus baekrokdamisoli]|uniref:Uncharacterized protein n=1 Tax=Paenibacillus baekrokdamisoli TaxID=1712516 RepID=A0A3G9JBM0_9BACL|nr:hypothetical protein [Paenibacillus baekrokdamisoli]MBB3073277.1 hypothetical protein [Paenibacillus baekrokdamisoli]BBH23291.1 hypothetical protein Back11_46360 [Paenibacillus baekrokdamisoli]
MGVKHGREYTEIVGELADAIGSIGDGYIFFEMETADWEELDEGQHKELMEVLADDVFYALGEDPVIAVGTGTVTYRPKHHCIEVSVDHKESRIIRLI